MIGICSGIFSFKRNSQKVEDYTELLSMFLTLCFVTAPLTVFVMSLRNKGINPNSAYRLQLIIGTCCLLLAGFRLAFFLIKIPSEKCKDAAIPFIKDNAPSILFAGFILLACISTWQQVVIDHRARWNKSTFLGTDFRLEGIYTYIIYVMIFLTASMIKREFYKKITVYSMAGVSVFIALLSFIANHRGISVFLYVHGLRGVFGHSNHYGYYIAVTSIILVVLLLTESPFNGRKATIKNIIYKVTIAVALLLQCVVLMYNGSLGSLVGVIAGIIFCGIAYSLVKGVIKPIIFAPISILVIVCVAYTWLSASKTVAEELVRDLPSDIHSIARNDEDSWAAGTWRWYLWGLTAEKIAERPFLGWGVEGIKDYLRSYTNSRSDTAEHKLQRGGIARPHNEYLQYAAFFGIPALLFYVGALGLVFLRGFKYRRTLTNSELCGLGGAFGYLVNAFFGVSLFYIAPLMFVCMGIGVARQRRANDLSI